MMDNDDDGRLFNFFAGLVLGAAVGAAVALLTAPGSGEGTRSRIRRFAGDLKEGANDRLDELAEDMKGRVDDAIQGARRRLTSENKGS